MRQSRLLHFWSDEPTTDAYRMMRWLHTRAIGQTKFNTGVLQEQELREVQSDHDTNSGKMRIDVRSS